MIHAQPQQSPVQTLVKPQAVILTRNEFTLLKPSGEIITGNAQDLPRHLDKLPLLCCFRPHYRNINISPDIPILDVLELFAFARPAQFCVPSVHGLSKTLNLQEPIDAEESAMALVESMETLLYDLKRDPYKKNADPLLIAQVMGQRGTGWAWTPYICDVLGEPFDPKAIPVTKAAMRIWKHLPEWSESAPPKKPLQS